jgi:hypothetical protein
MVPNHRKINIIYVDALNCQQQTAEATQLTLKRETLKANIAVCSKGLSYRL